MKKILFLGVFVSLILFSSPVQAKETSTSTPEIPEETPTSTEEIITPTSTPEIETPTTTIEIPTSTPDIETPTSTPTSTEEEITPTTTLDIDIPTSTDPIIESPTTTIETTTSTTSTLETEEPDENTGSAIPTIENQNILISDTEINNTVSKILSYLQSQQDETGKISDGTITDWIIMSFASKKIYADDIKNDGDSLLDYEKKYNLDDSSDLNVCASYPRHILALLSAGVGKNDDAILGLKNKILTECYNNNLYGQDGINDDVFGLLALLAIDFNKGETIIQDMVSAIMTDQTTDGAFTWSGWAGADMTGAAINALKYAQDKGININNQIFSDAKDYLKSQQLSDGGWGYGSSDIMTTSWVLMGLNALGETQSDWFNSQRKNPWYPFIDQINEEGFYESVWVPGSVDWFAMKHTVPALLGKSWPIILPEKVQNFSSGSSLIYIYTENKNVATTTEEIATSTMAITTSTLDITTTTLEITTSTIELTVTSTLEINTSTLAEITTSTNQMLEQENTKKEITSTTPDTPQIKIIKNETKDNSITPPSSSTTGTPTIESYQNIDSSTSTSTPETAKNVFEVSTGMAGAMGLYLIWKLMKSLL